MWLKILKIFFIIRITSCYQISLNLSDNVDIIGSHLVSLINLLELEPQRTVHIAFFQVFPYNKKDFQVIDLKEFILPRIEYRFTYSLANDEINFKGFSPKEWIPGYTIEFFAQYENTSFSNLARYFNIRNMNYMSRKQYPHIVVDRERQRFVLVFMETATKEQISDFRKITKLIYCHYYIIVYRDAVTGAIKTSLHDHFAANDVYKTYNGSSIALDQFFGLQSSNMFGEPIYLTFANDTPRSFIENNRVKGVEGWLIRTITEKLNGSYSIVPQKKTYIQDGVDVNLDLKYVSTWHLRENPEIQMALNLHRYVEQLVFIFKPFYHSTEDLVILIPSKEEKINFIESFKSFHISAITLYLICIITISIIWYVYKRFMRLKTSATVMALDIFGSAIMVSISQTPNKSFEKILLASILWINFIFYSCYQTFMIAHFMDTNYEPEIETFYDLQMTPNKTLIYNEIADDIAIKIYQKEHNINESLINMKSVFTPDKIFQFINNGSYVNFTFILTRSDANRILTSQWNYYGGSKKRFYQLKEIPYTTFMIYILKSGFPQYEEFGKILAAMAEGGLENYWKTRTTHEIFLANLNTFNTIHDEDLSEDFFGFRDFLNIAVVIIYIGWSLSVLIFLGEVGLHYCLKNSRLNLELIN